MPPKTTSLPNFPDLAGETRQQIFGLAGLPSNTHTINSGPAPNIVEVKFTRYPSFRRKVRGHPWRLVWTYTCKPWTVSPLLSTSVESRATYIRDNPDTLQLNRGTPVVHYNATRDTVYIDAESFFNLWHYVTVHRAQSRGNIPIPSTGETLPGAKQGSLAWRPFIILCTFAYKFISKLPQLNENAPSTPPLYRGTHHKNNTHPASVLEHL